MSGAVDLDARSDLRLGRFEQDHPDEIEELASALERDDADAAAREAAILDDMCPADRADFERLGGSPRATAPASHTS